MKIVLIIFSSLLISMSFAQPKQEVNKSEIIKKSPNNNHEIVNNLDSQVSFDFHGTKFSLHINGNFEFNNEALLNDLKKILKAEKRFFSDKEKSIFKISILPRKNAIEVNSSSDWFYCFFDTNQSARKIRELIAHEYFHNWFPNKMYLPTLIGEYDFKHEWFHEGFAEYLSRKILYDQSIIPKEYFIELLNKDLINIANNPSANETYEDIVSRNNFGLAQKKINHYRGRLIAFRWDHRLQEKGSSLKEMMLHLYSISKTTEGEISYNDIYSYGEKHALNFKEDIDAYIINGKTLSLETGAILAYQITNQKIKLFDPGFDVQKSAKEKSIQGVNPNGEAYKAGLRNGMQYVKRKNSIRWSNSWSEKLPYSVTVMINGTERIIEFFPYGKTVTVQLYQGSQNLPRFGM